MPKKGHKQSPDHTAKIAAANRGRKRSQEAIEATRAKRLGVPLPMEQIERQRESLRKRFEEPAFREANLARQRMRWIGHRRMHRGYVRVWISDDHPYASMRAPGVSWILEHRLVMAENLGRCLRVDELVHHVNFDRSDNRIENLQLMSRSEHMSLHNAARRADG